MTITIEQANAYFAVHLDAATWSGLTDDAKTAVITMAEGDVLNRLGAREIDAGNQLQVMAICEQAIYLYRNYAKQTEGKIITGQTLEGLGSQSFQIIGEAGFSPRAQKFVDQTIRMRNAGPVRLGRG